MYGSRSFYVCLFWYSWVTHTNTPETPQPPAQHLRVRKLPVIQQQEEEGEAGEARRGGNWRELVRLHGMSKIQSISLESPTMCKTTQLRGTPDVISECIMQIMFFFFSSSNAYFNLSCYRRIQITDLKLMKGGWVRRGGREETDSGGWTQWH